MLLGEIIELHHLPTAVRLRHAETDRAENSGNVGRVVIVGPRSRQRSAVHQPLQGKHAYDIGLCFLERGLQWSNRFSYFDPPVCGTGVCGTDSVTDLVHHYHRQVTIHGRHACLIFAHHQLRYGQDDVLDSRIHEILEEDSLAPFLFVNPRIVRKIIGDRLISVSQITGTEWSIHHFHRRFSSGL